MLKRLDDSDKRHDRVLSTILELNKRIDTIVEGQERMFKSIRPDEEL
jgi:hypothetical protein